MFCTSEQQNCSFSLSCSVACPERPWACERGVEWVSFAVKALCNLSLPGLPFSRNFQGHFFHGQKNRCSACFTFPGCHAPRPDCRPPVAGRNQQDQGH